LREVASPRTNSRSLALRARDDNLLVSAVQRTEEDSLIQAFPYQKIFRIALGQDFRWQQPSARKWD